LFSCFTGNSRQVVPQAGNAHRYRKTTGQARGWMDDLLIKSAQMFN
jgi:hypothetical protein